jgi:diguanylate cyclase (GGDEF)-like protein
MPARGVRDQAISRTYRFTGVVEADSQPTSRSHAWLRKSLARDTGVFVLGLCMLAAGLMGLAAREVLQSAVRSSLTAELSREFERVEAGFEAWRAQEAEDVAAIANSPELAAAARSPSGNRAVQNALSAKLEAESEALGLALIRGRSARADVSVAAASWLPEQWSTAIDLRTVGTEKPEIVRIEGTWVLIVAAPVASGAERGMLVAAIDPAAAFKGLGSSSRARVAIADEKGDAVAGSRATLALAIANGFVEADDAEGSRHLTLRRSLSNTPWTVAIALQQPSVPRDTITNVVLASLLIALLAGAIAFGVGERRMRPVHELAEGARRLASGESGVRVPVQHAHDELQMLARSFNDMAGQLEAQRRALEDRNHELLRANEVLEQLSITDGLTHLHNHRHFHDQFAREVKRADRSGQPLCLLLIDIDDFKALNDRHGHAAGDAVLAATAQLINDQVRESDYLARYGGEEFAMLLPQTDLDGAVALAEKIRVVLAEHAFTLPSGEHTVGLTVSIGVARHAVTADETFDAADRALYDAKAAGKDCVVAATPLDRPVSPERRRRRT